MAPPRPVNQKCDISILERCREVTSQLPNLLLRMKFIVLWDIMLHAVITIVCTYQARGVHLHVRPVKYIWKKWVKSRISGQKLLIWFHTKITTQPDISLVFLFLRSSIETTSWLCSSILMAKKETNDSFGRFIGSLFYFLNRPGRISQFLISFSNKRKDITCNFFGK